MPNQVCKENLNVPIDNKGLDIIEIAKNRITKKSLSRTRI